MNARTAIATALVLLPLAAPAAQAQIPSDHDGVGLTTLRVTLAVKLATNPFAARTTKQTAGWRG